MKFILKKPTNPTIIILANLIGLTTHAQALTVTSAGAAREGSKVRYHFIISNWSTTDQTMGPCSNRGTRCIIETSAWSNDGYLLNIGELTWIIPGLDNPTLGNTLQELQKVGFSIPLRSSLLIKESDINNNTCIGLTYTLRGADTPSGIASWGPFPSYINPPCLRLSSVSLPKLSCETPDVQVSMGEHFTRDFYHYGDTTLPKSFNIKLNKCSNGLTKVNYSLSANPTAPAVNATQGIVSLNKNSTAKGISLQVLDNNLQPIQLNKEYTFTPPTNTGGSFSIPMNARYIRTLPNGGSSPVTAGTANSEVAFVMSYL
jgi:type 1 fimbria pilin